MTYVSRFRVFRVIKLHKHVHLILEFEKEINLSNYLSFLLVIIHKLLNDSQTFIDVEALIDSSILQVDFLKQFN